MADAVSQDAAPPPESPGEKKSSRPGRPDLRFGVAYLGLAALVGAAVGLFIVFLGDSKTSGPSWSSFKPQEHGQAAVAEIARHVAPHYRLTSGDQLVGVISRPPEVQSTRISTIAVLSGFPDERSEDVAVYGAGNSMLFILCGFGKQCSIPQGKPSTARALLLRREGLELALYTFKYVSGVDSVLAIIPPPPGEQPKATLFFRKSDLEPQLGVPLRKTLSPRDRLIPGGLTPQSEQTVSSLTGRRVYQYKFQSVPDGTAAVVLTPLSA